MNSVQSSTSDPQQSRSQHQQTLEPATAAPPSTSASTPASSATLTITEAQGQEDAPPVLRLALQARPNVQWDESVVDNEGMGRKSSKRCCIFHKQRPFGESSTDTSDAESEGGSDDKKAARRKKVPDSQRFHA